MATSEVFNIQLRSETGGGASRALRRTGMVPGILYGGDQNNIPLMVDPRDILKGMMHNNFYTKIFELDVEGRKQQAFVRAVQLHPVTDRPLHIDFWRVVKGHKIHINVPLNYINESKCPGIKLGGLLNIVMHHIDVTCMADNIPAELTVDLSGAEMGAALTVDVLDLPEGVSLTHPERDGTIATIVPPKAEEEAATETTAS